LINYLRDTVQNPYLLHPHTEASKRKAKKKRTTKATTPEIEEEEEEDIEEEISESESDCIIVASSRSKSK
jgi:hypothetical protein